MQLFASVVLFAQEISNDSVPSQLAQLFGQDYAKLIVLRDPYVGEHTHESRAQLRSLPLLIEHGFDRVVHTDLWDNDFKLVSYDYHQSSKIEDREIAFPLVHVVSQKGMIDYDEQHLVRSLLRQCSSSNQVYIIVCDTNAPRTPAYTSERSFVDEFVPNRVIEYESLIKEFVNKNLNSSLPVSNRRGSKNLFFHQISDIHNSVGAPSSSLPELFDYENAPPNSPAWEPLYYFVKHDLQEILERYTERIREALRSWTERGDVQRIANNMDSMLTQCKFRVDLLDERRSQNAKMYNNA